MGPWIRGIESTASPAPPRGHQASLQRIGDEGVGCPGVAVEHGSVGTSLICLTSPRAEQVSGRGLNRPIEGLFRKTDRFADTGSHLPELAELYAITIERSSVEFKAADIVRTRDGSPHGPRET